MFVECFIAVCEGYKNIQSITMKMMKVD